MSIKRFFVIFVEFVTIATTLFAGYELFLSSRTVESFIVKGPFCSEGSEYQRLVKFQEFLWDNRDSNVYLNVDLSDVKYCSNIAFDNDVEAGFEDGYYSINLGIDKRLVENEDERGWEGYLMLNIEDFEKQVLSRLHFTIDYETHFLEGMVHIRALAIENDIGYEITPTPFHAEAESKKNCTESLLDKSGVSWLGSYMIDCVLA